MHTNYFLNFKMALCSSALVVVVVYSSALVTSALVFYTPVP